MGLNILTVSVSSNIVFQYVHSPFRIKVSYYSLFSPGYFVGSVTRGTGGRQFFTMVRSRTIMVFFVSLYSTLLGPVYLRMVGEG